MSNLRWLLIVLGTGAVLLQAQLWLSEGGYRKTMKLREAVAEQRDMNEHLRERNAALDAEVVNLKQGLEAAEERARTDLGLIGRRETFYQVVDADTPIPQSPLVRNDFVLIDNISVYIADFGQSDENAATVGVSKPAFYAVPQEILFVE